MYLAAPIARFCHIWKECLPAINCYFKVVIVYCIIISGEFGDVYKGTLQRPQEEKTVVAVKTLKVQI